MTKKSIMLVDVDNLYIVHGKINMAVLTKRINVIRAYGKQRDMKLYWFGNTFTGRLLQSHHAFSKLKLITSNIAKDTADHAILHQVEKSRSSEVVIVSNDASLPKVAWCLCPNKRITSLKFSGIASSELLEPEWINGICFKRAQDVEKFVLSYNFYLERYTKSLT